MAKQYGLIHPNAKTKPSSITGAGGPLEKGRLAAFQSDSDDSPDDDKNVSIKKHMFSMGITQKRQTQILHSTALNEDPTVFQYDEWYDGNDTKRKTLQETKKNEVKNSKYIDKLLVAADKRKKEFERRIERQVQKERELEGDKYKDKESFITSSYRQKLEDMKKAEEADQREEYLETIGDVTKQRDLGGFYRHLYEQKLGNNPKTITNKNKDISPKNKVITNNNHDHDDDDDDDDDDKNTQKIINSEKSNNKLKISNVKQERKYRKRKSSSAAGEEGATSASASKATADGDKSPSSSSDDDNTKEMNIKKTHLQSNLDADSDFSIDSSSSDSDDGDNTKKDNKNDNDNDDDTKKLKDSSTIDEIVDEFKKPFDPKMSQSAQQNKDDSSKTIENKIDLKQNIDKENVKINDNELINNNDKETTIKEEIEEVKKDIWKKRTIGEIFDAALQRYYDRKMLK